MTATAIVTAGGTGTRLGGQIPKQFLPVAGAPMVVHTLRAFEASSLVSDVVLVLPPTYVDYFPQSDLDRFGLTKIRAVIPGGATRQESVGLGLEAVTWPADAVAIHDAARCLVTPRLIDETIQALKEWDGVIAALPVRDTLKHVENNEIEDTEPRENLWAMQTPQVFRFPLIRDAYRRAAAGGFQATDDAAVAERAGARVGVTFGSPRNLKVTYAEDLQVAHVLLTYKGPGVFR